MLENDTAKTSKAKHELILARIEAIRGLFLPSNLVQGRANLGLCSSYLNEGKTLNVEIDELVLGMKSRGLLDGCTITRLACFKIPGEVTKHKARWVICDILRGRKLFIVSGLTGTGCVDKESFKKTLLYVGPHFGNYLDNNGLYITKFVAATLCTPRFCHTNSKLYDLYEEGYLCNSLCHVSQLEKVISQFLREGSDI